MTRRANTLDQTSGVGDLLAQSIGYDMSPPPLLAVKFTEST
ncbi:hypothetical protein [Gordonia sp. i37]|nr:hypothetical protein [Gordonia sp. i37]